MTARRHRSDTRTFRELTFAGQAKSLNAQLSTLTRAVEAHVQRADQEGGRGERTRAKCVRQLDRLRARIAQ
jgi:hypothetical protein